MNLVWKLLRQHISIPQFVGFFFANLVGVATILLGVQFYNDYKALDSEDSFMKADYLIVNKKIGAFSGLTGAQNTFSQTDIDSIRQLQEAPTVKLLKLAAETAEDNARAYLQIQHFYSLDSLGKPGQTIEEADICLQLHFESNEWKVRMVGPPQSGK